MKVMSMSNETLSCIPEKGFEKNDKSKVIATQAILVLHCTFYSRKKRKVEDNK